MPEKGIVSSPHPVESSGEPWPTRIGNFLLSRQVGAVAATLFILIILGCMSLSFGGLSIGCKTEADGTVCQEGEVKLHSGKPLQVYYPAPYATPPNLELSGDQEKCEIMEQQADHFCVRVRGDDNACLHWKARGLRGIVPVSVPALPAPAPPATVPPPTEGGSIPLPEPTPVKNP